MGAATSIAINPSASWQRVMLFELGHDAFQGIYALVDALRERMDASAWLVMPAMTLLPQGRWYEVSVDFGIGPHHASRLAASLRAEIEGADLPGYRLVAAWSSRGTVEEDTWNVSVPDARPLHETRWQLAS